MVFKGLEGTFGFRVVGGVVKGFLVYVARISQGEDFD